LRRHRPPDETRRKALEAEGQKGPLPIIRLSYPKEGQPPTEVVTQVAAELHLRGLNVLEAGRPISATARGTYFFVDPINLGENRGPKWEALQVLPDRREYVQLFLLESGEILMLAYCSEADAARIGALNGIEAITVAVSAEPWTHMRVLVVLPKERIQSVGYRSLRGASPNNVNYVLDLLIQ
jgi:hypothetical protein